MYMPFLFLANILPPMQIFLKQILRKGQTNIPCVLLFLPLPLGNLKRHRLQQRSRWAHAVLHLWSDYHKMKFQLQASTPLFRHPCGQCSKLWGYHSIWYQEGETFHSIFLLYIHVYVINVVWVLGYKAYMESSFPRRRTDKYREQTWYKLLLRFKWPERGLNSNYQYMPNITVLVLEIYVHVLTAYEDWSNQQMDFPVCLWSDSDSDICN